MGYGMDEYEGGVNFDEDEVDEVIGWSRRKKETVKRTVKTKSANSSRGTKVQRVCHCGQSYMVRVADLNRGWGLSCSKKCAAVLRNASIEVQDERPDL